MTYLTKSRYIAGQQCHRKLWLTVHEPAPWEAPQPGSIQDVGQEIGVKAHLLFPGGVQVNEMPWEHESAMARTAALMADKTVSAIFEAAFEYDEIRIRVDVLERLSHGRWGIREVKSSGKPKPYYLDDISVQLYVLKGLGLRVPSVELILVNTDYVRGKRGISWPKFFKRLDVQAEVLEKIGDVERAVVGLKKCLRKRKEPVVEVGDHCRKPFDCEFWGRCTADKPDDWIDHLPGLKGKRYEEIKALGIDAITEIPEHVSLTVQQAGVRNALVTGAPHVSPNLFLALKDFGPPAMYLDFETFAPAIPAYPGTELLPVSWTSR